MLNWLKRFNICAFLDNHQYTSGHHAMEVLAAAGAVDYLPATREVLPALKQFISNRHDWLFGHVCYDLSNELAGLKGGYSATSRFPVAGFFQPETVVSLKDGLLQVSCISSDPQQIYNDIRQASVQQPNRAQSIQVQPRISRETYLQRVSQLLAHIRRGDCYEINFCQEFYAEGVTLDAASLYTRLTEISPNPFSCFYKWQDQYLLCASPERFVKKEGHRIISQPIKGTLKRDTSNAAADALLADQLKRSEKDRSENVMVVDIVRNDLSRICTEGSVRVEELFGLYSFPQVHQLISTVTGELKKEMDLTDVLAACFPMGSMTGAPKKRVMELINQYESNPRGLYSGAVGYISPEQDFDFNVVIRSILYNAADNYLGYSVGGGITALSVPEQEYEECLLKAAAIRKVLSGEVAG